MGQGGPAHADDAEEVDVEDPVPLVVAVLPDVALRTDPRVVDQHVESAEVADDTVDRGADGGVVGDVGAHPQHAGGDTGDVEVERRAACSPRRQLGHDGGTDAGAAPGDDGDQARVLALDADRGAHAGTPGNPTISWRWRPSPSISSSTTSPALR